MGCKWLTLFVFAQMIMLIMGGCDEEDWSAFYLHDTDMNGFMSNKEFSQQILDDKVSFSDYDLNGDEQISCQGKTLVLEQLMERLLISFQNYWFQC